MGETEEARERIYTCAAFLRGINVGGNNIVSMARLRTCFDGVGLLDARTHANSGNVIFNSTLAHPRELEDIIEKGLVGDFEIPIRVVVRSYQEMKRTIEAMPGDWDDDAGWKRDVIFLRHPVDSPRIVQDLQPKAGLEELRYSPGVLFWSVRRKDWSRSSLSKIVGTKLYQEMTVRSPGTTRKVYELMSALVGSSTAAGK